MDELAIIREPIRKRAKIGDNKYDEARIEQRGDIASLPVEIVIEILSYLSYEDLRALGCVSKFFERLVRDPTLWRTYEVTNNGADTSQVIEKLRKMPLLRRLSINARADCDDILRQLSRTNRNLETLYVFNCTGSTSKLYLRSAHLIRILERCRRLHTINIRGTRFRGRKFYRLLGDMGLRLKAATTPATSMQFCTFIKYARHIDENDRRGICAMCNGAKTWAPLHYFMIERPGGVRRALINYLHSDYVSVDVGKRNRKELGTNP